MKVAIANDHGGYELKTKIMGFLKDDLKLDVLDYGCGGTQIVRYPYYAARVCQAIQKGEVDKGILICSTGIGMSIVANKFKGIRAALVDNSYSAEMTTRHNDSNVICLGGRCIGDFNAIDFLKRWFGASFEGGRHCISLGIIEDIEEKNFAGEDYTLPEVEK